MTGDLSSVGEARRQLPADIPAGVLPVLYCYVTIGASTNWVPVTDGYTTTSLFCRLERNGDGTWAAFMTNDAPLSFTFVGYRYAFVVVY